jgi:hypothetical protein
MKYVREQENVHLHSSTVHLQDHTINMNRCEIWDYVHVYGDIHVHEHEQKHEHEHAHDHVHVHVH